MKLIVKKINYETGNSKDVVVNIQDAQELGQKAGERIVIKNMQSKSIEDKYWVAIMQIDFSRKIVERGEIGLFLDIFNEKKELKDGVELSVKPADRPNSFKFIKKKVNNQKLNSEELSNIISDAVSGLLSRIELASFITSVAINGMDKEEMTALTMAEARSGEIFDFGPNIYDKHSTKDYIS